MRFPVELKNPEDLLGSSFGFVVWDNTIDQIISGSEPFATRQEAEDFIYLMKNSGVSE